MIVTPLARKESFAFKIQVKEEICHHCRIRKKIKSKGPYLETQKGKILASHMKPLIPIKKRIKDILFISIVLRIRSILLKRHSISNQNKEN